MTRKKKIVFFIVFGIFAFAVCRFIFGIKWKMVTPMPHGRYWHDSVLGPDGKIYTMGGTVHKVVRGFKKGKGFLGWSIDKYNSGPRTNLIYDPKTDTWEYGRGVPGFTVRGKNRWLVYDTQKDKCFGLFKPKDKIYPADKYDRWDSKVEKKYMVSINDFDKKYYKFYKTELERQGVGISLITGIDGRIYWLGGMGRFQGNGESIVLPYNPKTGQWPEAVENRIRESPAVYRYYTVYQTEVPAMHEVRIGFDAVTASDGKIYAIAGMHYIIKPPHGHVPEVSKTMECYDPQTNKWTYKKSLPRPRMRFAAVITKDDKIYVLGGAAGDMTLDSTPILDTVEVYDPKTDEWTFRHPMPAPRYTHAAVLGADDRIYVIGGEEKRRGSPLKSVLIYDPKKDTWTKGPDMTVHRSCLSAVATPDGKIYAIGGSDVGAYERREKINIFVPKKMESYTGKVQDTVEVLDINDL